MQPFSDIRVLDLTHVIAGPFCTFQLGVMGADVIKVEPADEPDMVRQDGGDPARCMDGMGSVFLSQSANKRALAVNLKTTEGQEIIKTLARSADVLVENYRPGALKKIGLDYESIRQIRPDIIYCSLTGFGQHGPLSERTAYDNVIQAISGLMASTGDSDSTPMKVGPPVLDYGTGIQGAFAIAAALYQRKSTGKGQRIDLAMMDAAIMLSSTSFTHLQSSGNPPVPSGNSNAKNHGYGCYQTEDGLLMLGAYNGRQLASMWQVLGDETKAREAATQKLWNIAETHDSDRARVAEILLTRPAEEWELLFNSAKVPASKVRGVDEAATNPHLGNRGVFQTVLLDGEEINLPAAAFSYSENGPSIRSAPPRHGQHTREILYAAGYDSERVNQLELHGVIKPG